MKSSLICTAAVLGMMFVGSTQVEAGNRNQRSQHNNHSNNNSHRNHNSHNNHNSHSNHSNRNYSNYNRRSYGYGNSISFSNGNFGISYNFGSNNVRPRYHNTSHYDYHGPSLQRHGNHYDVAPRHYDYHRTGRCDY